MLTLNCLSLHCRSPIVPCIAQVTKDCVDEGLWKRPPGLKWLDTEKTPSLASTFHRVLGIRKRTASGTLHGSSPIGNFALGTLGNRNLIVLK